PIVPSSSRGSDVFVPFTAPLIVLPYTHALGIGVAVGFVWGYTRRRLGGEWSIPAPGLFSGLGFGLELLAYLFFSLRFVFMSSPPCRSLGCANITGAIVVELILGFCSAALTAVPVALVGAYWGSLLRKRRAAEGMIESPA